MATRHKPLKILNAVFSKQNGGLEQASMDYVQAFLALGHEVAFIVGDRAPFLGDAEKLGCLVLLFANHYGHYDLPAILRLRACIVREKPDIVFAHGNRAIALLRLAAKGLAPFVAVNHTFSVKRSKRADHVIVVNEGLKLKLQEAGHKNTQAIHVIPNMVHITPAQYDWHILAHFHEPPVIGTLARLSPEKGIDRFIRAIAQLPGVCARIGGDGTQRAELEALAKELGVSDRIEFVGWVKEREAFYRSLDLFCLASDHETFGIVILEAMQHKLPVIATQTVGTKQLADGKEVIEFVPVGDVAALVSALMRLLAAPEVAHKLAEKGFAHVAQKYDRKVVGQRLQEMIEDICKT